MMGLDQDKEIERKVGQEHKEKNVENLSFSMKENYRNKENYVERKNVEIEVKTSPKIEDNKVENWLDVARKKLKKIEKETPKKIMKKKILKHENITTGTSNRRKKLVIGERKNTKVNEIKNMFENIKRNKEEKKPTPKKKILKPDDGMSSLKAGKLLTDVKMNRNSVNIVDSPGKSELNLKFDQPTIDALRQRNDEVGKQTRNKKFSNV